jgi:oligopeptide/dipeptide ABC transporter ATP-binding protein
MTPLLELKNVSRAFEVKRKQILAVNDVSFEIGARDVVCLVGESGCGKTTIGKMIAGLLKPSAGTISYNGRDIVALTGSAFTDYRLAVQLVHQDPYASLNPASTVFDTLSAPLMHHGITRGGAATRNRVRDLLAAVKLTPVDDFIDKYPHQLSGGQRQRVSIARALSVSPKLIVADEAVASVDTSIRISLLNTLAELREKMGLSVLFITHDLALARFFAWEGQVGVMYLGRMVEHGPTQRVIDAPQHPYTRTLLSAIPEADPAAAASKERIVLRSEDIPSLLNLPGGCAFHTRCPWFAGDACATQVPKLERLGDVAVACHPLVRGEALKRI